MVELLSSDPPDDTGSDVLERYRYQARVAFPYCLECCTGNSIVSVFMEHFEDVVVDYGGKWHFMQIKTRNPDRGPWKLYDTLGPGGGLRSLARTYRASKDLRASYGLHLEGATAKRDLLGLFASREIDSDNPDLSQKLMEKLGFSTEETEEFLGSLIVRTNLPHRNNIDAHNIRLLGQVASRVSHGEIERTYEKCVDEIIRAMSGEPLREQLLMFIRGHNGLKDDIQMRVEAKRLTKERLLRILGVVTLGPYPLISRIVNHDLPQPTDLEIKLLLGGLQSQTIDDAKSLRANAARREAQLLSAHIHQQADQLEDVRERLRILANSILQRNSQEPYPAREAWAEMLRALTTQSEHVDPNNLFRRDPYTLLGVICGLTDECLISWGVSDA